ncbi:hypothetical protein RM549_06095 [Salegentibacter sp. F188]|uniref:Uncharacterized protein n=1 Tax=Autumnicola patrickiae TaxID=3075591 RepID=A0ABU3E025_9FLAO|nr:hypothetical protein [Salegentibacter sp. F188]MDT0689348.1 hypothetical protein [Salegentibacter sp. F188]
MATEAEITELKKNWKRDPCWDIYDTEGFEEHREELETYQKEQELIWETHRRHKLKQKAERMGVPGNLVLARYIEGLETTIIKLREDIDKK